MLRKKQDGVEWLEFELLQLPEIKHGVFLKHGGASSGPFASFNLSRATADDPSHVEKNRKKLCEILKIEKLFSGYQVHKSNVALVESDKLEYPECDGLLTNQSNHGLFVLHADCQATLFYDPIHKAIANVHAGWRGQVQDIYRKTVNQMGAHFGTKAEDLLVCISPSLGPLHAEFKNYRQELPEIFWPFQIKPTYFDLWRIARYQLEEIGILSHHIEIAEMDTYEDSENFFSYRREKEGGRHGTVIALRDKNML